MNIRLILPIFAVVSCAWPVLGQGESTAASRAGTALPPAQGTGDYASDVEVVLNAQAQALEQARHALQEAENARGRAALQSAIQAMERSRAALAAAKSSPEKLSTALAAAESAYQALLKSTPREYRVNQSRSRSRGGASSGQPSQEELSQLELSPEENRYETEQQATAAPNEQQREQSQTLDRLKQLARRQQDLNDRLRDLQTALQQARTDAERQEVQRQLKRLRDEQRQMLSDVDELRQRLEQSPQSAQQAGARQQLDQTRNDMQRAAQELEQQSASGALAAGARAEQNLQTLRENLRQQSSSQFSQQMRQMRTQARDLANRENQIARDLDSLNNAAQKSLDDSAQRQALVEQMARQQSALTNLLGQMRAVTEQAETTEPLLSKQLYDILRRADQMHTDNQLEMGGRLVDRGFLPQASQAERVARQNIDEMRQGVERAAESVLGSETQALRYAQKELDDLARQVGSEVASTNSANASAGQTTGDQNKTSSQARAGSRNPQRGPDAADTNALASAGSEAGQESAPTAGEANAAHNQQSAGRQAGSRPGSRQANAKGGQRATNPTTGESSQTGQGQGVTRGGTADRDRLRQFAEGLGGGRGGLGLNGPITGNNYLDWTERMRDVEQAVDSPDVRNQLATVRERVGVYRREYREQGKPPSQEDLQNKVLAPLALARDWVGQELSRAQNDRSLVPLDRDPVQEKYSDLVRKYYEELGSPR